MTEDEADVDFLADAYRNYDRSELARLVVRNRFADYPREVRARALARVQVETAAELAAVEAQRVINDDELCALMEVGLRWDL